MIVCGVAGVVRVVAKHQRWVIPKPHYFRVSLRAVVPPGSSRATVDLVLELRPEDAEWFHALRDVLDEAERLAAAGELLASPGPAEIIAVRHWACDQVLDQLAGAPPVAWDGPLRLGGAGPPSG